MTQLTISGHNYHIAVSGEGIPIVLLHGFTGDTTIWESVREELEQHHSVIAIDILGHGHSDKPEDIDVYRMESVAGDIVQLLDSISVEKVHLLGYSMGGRLALYLATHFPEHFHSLILESASAGLETEQEREERRVRDNALADKIEAKGIDWFVDFWETLSLWDSQKSLTDDVLMTQRKQRLSNNPRGLANSLRGMGTGVQPSLWDALDGLMIPTQLIVGEHDRKFIRINREMVKRIPNVALTTIPNAGHTVHLENLSDFMRCVKSFIM